MTKKYTSPAADGDVYHSTLDCERIDNPERFEERSDAYVEWHDLDRCGYCCGENIDQPNQPSKHDMSIFQAAVEHGEKTT